MQYKSVIVVPEITPQKVYFSGSLIGGLLTFPLDENQADGYISKISIFVRGENNRPHFHLHWFDNKPVGYSDREKFICDFESMRHLICDCEITPDKYVSRGTHTVTHIMGIRLEFLLQKKDIYAYVECIGGTPTFLQRGDLVIKLGVYINK